MNYLEKEENIIKEVFLKEFKKIYNANKNKCDFEYDFNKVYNIFSKDNQKNKEGEIFLREFKYFFTYNEKKNEPILNQYATWIDELNISHIRNIEHLFIYGTWYSPNGFVQILIVLYKDKKPLMKKYLDIL